MLLPLSSTKCYSLLDLVQKKPFFLVEGLSEKDFIPFEPNEKWRSKKGFPGELFMLELELFLRYLPRCPLLLCRSNGARLPLKSLSTTRFLDLFRAFKSIWLFNAFSDIFNACFSPNVQTGQAGSYLLISGVILSKHSAWKTWPQINTETTESSFAAHEDLSVNSFVQMPHVWRSIEGEPELGPLALLTLSRWKPVDSLSNDHLSLRGFAARSEKAGRDHPSDDPPFEPLVDSLLQPGSTKDDDSSEIEGDFIPGIWLSETRRPSWWLEEYCGKGIELAGSSWLFVDKGDVANDETEGADGDTFPGEGHGAADDSNNSLT